VNENHYAVVVGINRYPGISDLAGPVNDAAAFYGWLVDDTAGGLPPENAWLVEASAAEVHLLEPYDAEPKRWRIDRALGLAVRKARTDIGDDPDRWDRSRLYFFVAGHGIAPYGSDAALLAADAQRGAYGSNLDIRLHVDWLRRCADFREVVVFADCCRNRVNNATPGGPVFDSCPITRGVVVPLVGYATAFSDLAYEEVDEAIPPDQRRGYFSKALMEALSGDSGAADPASGDVTAASLAAWLTQRVAALTEDKAVRQRVEMPVPSVPMLFREATGRPQHAVAIHVPPGETRGLVLIDHTRSTIEASDAVPGVAWQVALEDGVYQVVLADTEDGSVFAGSGLFEVRGEGRDVQL